MSIQLDLRSYLTGDRHAHDYNQILCPLSGSMRVEIEGRCGIAASHRLAVIPQRRIHDFQPSRDCRLLVLDVDVSALPGGTPALLAGEPGLIAPVAPWLWRLFRLLGAEVEADPRRARDAAEVALSGLRLVQPIPSPPPSARDRRVIAVQEALDDGAEPRGVAQMARAAGLGRSQFHAIFRTMTGGSPKQRQLQKLLDRAVDRLIGTADPVSEIAYGLGYQNVSSFNRLFKNRFGVTPTQFRAIGGSA